MHIEKMMEDKQDLHEQEADEYMMNQVQKEKFLLINQIPCGIFQATLDQNLTLIYTNQYFNEIFLYAQDEIKTMRELMLTEEFEELHEYICKESQYEEKRYYEIERNFQQKDGNIIWILARYRYDNGYMYGIVLDMSEHKQKEEKLRIREQEYRIVMHHSKNTLLRYHIPTRVLSMENPDDHVLGNYTEVENVPECVKSTHLVSEDTLNDYIAFFQQMIDGVDHGEAMFQMLINDTHKYSWVKASYVLTYDDHHQPVTAIISYQNYTEEYEQQIAYQRWMQFFEQQKKKAIAYYEYDISKDRLEAMESTVTNEMENDQRHSFTFVAQYSAKHFVYKDDCKAYLAFFNREHLIACYYEKNCQLKFEHRRLRKDGSSYWSSAEIQLIKDPYTETIKAFVTIYDIDEDKRRELQMKNQLESDPLTGLYNRRSISAKVTKVLTERCHYQHALIMLDLDHFKELNDKMGHLKGDEVLCEVAHILKKCLRKEDLCARIGGDEYIIFLKDIQDEQALSKKMTQLKEALCLSIEGMTFSASIGAAIFPQHGKSFEELYENADKAMYDAKHGGRNLAHIYQEEV